MSFSNIGELLRARVSAYDDKPFLYSETDGREWTYAEFEGAVHRTANLLASMGVTKGDVVSLLLPNSAEYIVAYFACWKVGAIAGPVNSLLKPEEVEWVVGNSESKLMLTEAQTPPVTSAKHKLFDNLDTATAGFPDTFPEIGLDPDDEAIIIYTSGTTGKPKGCLLTHGNLLANAEQITRWMEFGPDDRLLTVMPLFHMNAVTVTTMSALFCGGSTVVSPKFSASRFWEIIGRYGITSFGSVATMLSMLLSSGQSSVFGGQKRSEDDSLTTDHRQLTTSLRFAMCGSAPVPAEVLKRFEETFGVLVIEGYGLSESTCRSSFNPPNEDRRPGSCGLPIGNEMKVFDESDVEVKDGCLGEIVLRGPNIFKGYYKNPDATANAFANGWFHTGDIGYRDADGFFYIADRKSDMIIRGGENIYPREIDDLLYTHPAVAHAAVIGVPDDLYGEEVAAFVVLKDGYTSGSSPNVSSPHVSKGSSQAIDPSPEPNERTPTAETRTKGSVPDSMHKPARKQWRDRDSEAETISDTDIIAFCKLHLADYKCPKTVYFVDDIPKGPTGKLLKRELAKLFARVQRK